MANIFYAVAGEGRGHATRAGTVVEQLRDRHDITLFAPSQAFALLDARYRGSEVRVVEIEGPAFHYRHGRRVDKLRTALGGAAYLRRLPALVAELARRIRAERPELCITDFDPALPRAAERCGVPYISVDHQNFLVVGDFRDLPVRLRLHAAMIARLVRGYYRRQVRTIVSSFAFPPLRPKYRDVVRAGVLLRPELIAARSEHRDHVCVYLRRFTTANVIDALQACGRNVRIYGLGAHPPAGRLSFHAVDERRFIEDLATCHALVSTAGNQLVGEALWLGKPVLALPEDGNDEQRINAHLLARTGAGAWRPFGRLNTFDVRSFLDSVEPLRARIDRRSLCGNSVVLGAIRAVLREPEQVAQPELVAS